MLCMVVMGLCFCGFPKMEEGIGILWLRNMDTLVFPLWQVDRCERVDHGAEARFIV